jgi:uncharacterized membrane protein
MSTTDAPVDTNKTGSAGRRTPRWLMALLIGSLALNLLIAGAVGTRVWSMRHGGDQVIGRQVLGFLRGLPQSRKAELEPQIKAMRQAIRQARKSNADLRAQVATALTAEPFDPATLERVVRQMLDGDATVRSTRVSALVDLAKSLTPDERSAMLKQMRLVRPRGPERAPARRASRRRLIAGTGAHLDRANGTRQHVGASARPAPFLR